jgi:hypothetical protein
MCATRRLAFSMDASTTEELDVGEQQHRGHPIPSYEQILKKKENFMEGSFYQLIILMNTIST